MDNRVVQQTEAYRMAQSAFAQEGGYVRSPYNHWSHDDMAWEAGMDDAREAAEAATEKP